MGTEGTPQPTPDEVEKAGEEQLVKQKVMGNLRREEWQKLGLDPKDLGILKRIEIIKSIQRNGVIVGFICKMDGHTIVTGREGGNCHLEIDGIAVSDQEKASDVYRKLFQLSAFAEGDDDSDTYYGRKAEDVIRRVPYLLAEQKDQESTIEARKAEGAVHNNPNLAEQKDQGGAIEAKNSEREALINSIIG